MVVRESKVSAPCEVLGTNVGRRNRSLYTVRLHRSDVRILTTDDLAVVVTHQVEVVAPVSIGNNIDTVVQETEIDTDVELVLLLISKVLVTKTGLIESEFLLVALRTPHVGRAEDRLGIGCCRLLTYE